MLTLNEVPRACDRWLLARSGSFILGLALGLLMIVTAVDRAAPIDLHFTVFYLAPIFVASWYGGGQCGALMALLSTAAWVTGGDLGRSGHYGTISIWNTVVTCAIFVTNAYTVKRLRLMTHELHSARVALREYREKGPRCEACGADARP